MSKNLNSEPVIKESNGLGTASVFRGKVEILYKSLSNKTVIYYYHH